MAKVGYVLNTNEITSGANKNYVDLFNASGSGYKVFINAVRVRVKTDVAVTGTLAVRLDRFRTSSAPANGTNVAYASASASTANIIPLDSNQPAIPPAVTAQVAPATAGTATVWLGMSYHFSEETSDAANASQNESIMLSKPVVLNPGQGLSIRQGSVASTNSYAVEVHFEVEEEE